jgi:serine/threonine-protein kinase
MGLVVGAAGIVGIGVGSFFGLRAISIYGDAKDHCPDVACKDAEGLTLTDDAKNAASAANIAFGIGLVALAGGVVLYLTAPSAGGTADSGAIHARLGPGSIMLGGSFR